MMANQNSVGGVGGTGGTGGANAASGAGDDDEASGGVTSVTITDNGDGTYAVAMSEDDDDPADESGQGGGDQPEQADSLEQALEMAGEMLSGQGSDDSGGAGDSDGDDDNAQLSPEQARAYWRSQLKAKRAGK